MVLANVDLSTWRCMLAATPRRLVVGELIELHWKLAGTGSERKSLVNLVELGFAQMEIPAPRVFGGVLFS